MFKFFFFSQSCTCGDCSNQNNTKHCQVLNEIRGMEKRVSAETHCLLDIGDSSFWLNLRKSIIFYFLFSAILFPSCPHFQCPSLFIMSTDLDLSKSVVGVWEYCIRKTLLFFFFFNKNIGSFGEISIFLL